MSRKIPYFPKYNIKMLFYGPALCLLIVLFVSIFAYVDICRALTPEEIIVIANRDVRESVPLALFYMKKREIPYKNLIIISVGDKERCHREDFDKKIALPVRLFLHQRDPKKADYACILTMYGVPLIIDDESGLTEKIALTKLQEKLRRLRHQGERLPAEEGEKHKALAEKMEKIRKQIIYLEKADRTAAVDSELALVSEKTYPLAGWVPNPAYLGYQGKQMLSMPRKAFLIARLDGPSPAIVRRIINDSLTVEERGLRGKAYFDARWPDPGNKRDLSSYAFFDHDLHQAAALVKKSGVMSVVLNEKEQLFQPGECPAAALYCGWYSFKKYVDAFGWVPGAVGYHVASGECVTLKNRASNVWCKIMLEKGVAATIGPVGEPYLEAFPPPKIFFELLLGGRLALAECFALSSPFLSWKMVLIGDPLYRPFKNVKY